MARTDTDLEMLKEIAQAHSKPGASSPASTTPTTTEPRSKSNSTKDDLPVYFYNSRYPFETVVDPNDPNRVSPRQFSFVGGQFIATEPWQVELLRKKRNVFEADTDIDLDPCESCGYRTRSIRDFQNHIKKHLS